jgi:acyl-coenzyme A synthetase/AMP-(fatty) acid ligase
MTLTENIITRHCLNQDLIIYQHNDKLQLDHEFNYAQLCDMIDYWKVLLVEKYNITAGQTCYLDLSKQDIYYYSLVFAICELGLIIVIDLPLINSFTKLETDYRLNMHGKIDYWFADSTQLADQTNQIRFNYIGRNIVDPFEEFNNYTIKDHSLFKTIASAIWCTPEMPLIWTSSSGTTNVPKKVIESHHKIYSMSKRMIPLLNFKKSDRVCHTKNIHHGSSVVLFFIPSFMACDYHLTKVWSVADPNASVQKLVKFTDQEKPNHLFLYTTDFLTEFLQLTSAVDSKLELLTLYQITPEIIKLQKEKNVAVIRSTYGESTIGSAILLKNVPKDVDLGSYEITNMGPKVDDFYDLQIENNQLEVSIPGIGQGWKSTGDVFTILNNNYYFHGRSDLYRIGYSWINIGELEKEVTAHFGTSEGRANATAVIDSEMQKIYLAVWTDTAGSIQAFTEHLYKTYDRLTPAYTITDQPYTAFIGARKIDHERVRDYCRKKLNLTGD